MVIEMNYSVNNRIDKLKCNNMVNVVSLCLTEMCKGKNAEF